MRQVVQSLCPARCRRVDTKLSDFLRAPHWQSTEYTNGNTFNFLQCSIFAQQIIFLTLSCLALVTRLQVLVLIWYCFVILILIGSTQFSKVGTGSGNLRWWQLWERRCPSLGEGLEPVCRSDVSTLEISSWWPQGCSKTVVNAGGSSFFSILETDQNAIGYTSYNGAWTSVFFQGPGLVDSVLLGTLAKIMAACKTRLWEESMSHLVACKRIRDFHGYNVVNHGKSNHETSQQPTVWGNFISSRLGDPTIKPNWGDSPTWSGLFLGILHWHVTCFKTRWGPSSWSNSLGPSTSRGFCEWGWCLCCWGLSFFANSETGLFVGRIMPSCHRTSRLRSPSFSKPVETWCVQLTAVGCALLRSLLGRQLRR